MAATTAAFEAEIAGFGLTDRGMCAGAAYRLRMAYLSGSSDPTAHTLALANTDYVDALARNAKTASFAAIAGP
jgi:hypothetical protein